MTHPHSIDRILFRNLERALDRWSLEPALEPASDVWKVIERLDSRPLVLASQLGDCTAHAPIAPTAA